MIPSRLVLCGFAAYTQQLNGSKKNIVEIQNIPPDVPTENIDLDCVHAKYPQLLQDLLRRGPTDAFFLVKCWTTLSFNHQQNSLFAVDSFYEATEKFDIIVSTKVCSFGRVVVDKVEIYSPIDEEEEAKCPVIWHFKLEKSPMCEYMVRFISELKKLQAPSLMNSVLENFTVLQIVTNKDNGNTLMAIAFMFEIREDGVDEISTNIYRIKE